MVKPELEVVREALVKKFFCCHHFFFCYNALLKITRLGGYGHRFKDKVLALFEGSH